MALSPIGQKLAGQFNKPTNTGLLKISNPSLVNPPVKFGVDIPKPVLPNTNFSTANTTPRAVQPTLLSEIGKKLWQGNIGGAIGNEAVNATRGGVAVNTLLGLPKNTLKVGKEILQGTARVTATAGITAGNAAFRAVGQPEPFAPSTPTNNNPVTNAVFGGVPVKNLSTYGQTALDMIESSTGKKINPKTAPFVGALGIATEFYGGPGKKGVVDLSTKLLTKLEGKTTVSKQFISDLTNSPDLKQAEKDLIRRILETEGDKVDVPAFASKVRGELLPLQSKQHLDDEMMDVPGGGYENTTLPPEIRGPVYNYNERVYESPVKTSAGNVHSGLPKSDSYFAHSRYEDMADEMLPDGTPGYNESGVRRVIEVQSDLFQKGRLDEEKGQWGVLKGNESRISVGEAEMIKRLDARESEVSKLEPYRNTWQDRIVREEVKKAAQDGKTKLQFPTGETAMKIEGLGGTHQVWGSQVLGAKLTPDNIYTGLEIQRIPTAQDFGVDVMDKWIITDVLGDGKFKAVSKQEATTVVARFLDSLPPEVGDMDGFEAIKYLSSKPEYKKYVDHFNERASETFDISGKVDTNNPIYKFYEKEMGRYLKNKYGAERVTDAQGVSWWEVPVKKEYGTQPVEAFKRGDKNYTKNVTLANLKADIKRIIGVDLPIFGKDFMGEGVEGSFYRGIINILEKGGKVSDFVGKHETWHLIKNGLVTKEEKAIIEAMEQDLIKQFPKKAKALRDEGYSPEEIAEELMANEFARYYQRGTTFSEKLKVIFDKIIQRVTLIVKNKSQVLTYFKDIQSKSTGVIKGNGGRIKYSKSGGGKNWREGYRQETDSFKKEAILKAIANMKSTDIELRDILDNIKSLGNKASGESAGIAWDVAQNPAASVITKQRALALREEVFSMLNGESKVYHGTNEKFDTFDLKNQKSGYYPGAYTTTDAEATKKFGANLLESKIDNSKFYKIEDGGDSLKKEARQAGFETKEANGNGEVAYLKSKGFEGIQRGKEFIIFEPTNLKKSITPIDRLIAEGKVRVRSKNGKDIYEIKKGGNWKTVRDEDSAIKQLTPVLKPVVKKVEVTPIPLTGDAPVMSKEQLAKYETKLIQLSSAEAGERVGQFEESGKFMGYRAKRSTFPAHYAENLRSKKLFDKYMDGVGGRQRQGVPEDFLMKYKEGSLLDQLDQQVREDIGLPMLKREAKADIKQAKLQQKLLTPKTPKTTRISKAEAKSLEELANQQLEALPLPPREKPLSLKEIVTQTPVSKKVGLHDLIRTPDRVLQKIGFGKEADLLRNQYEKYVIELPKNIKQITAWSKQVPKGSSNKLFRYLDGEDVILTKEEQRVAGEIKEYLAHWADRLGLPDDKRVTNYITHLFEDQLIKKEFDEDLAKLIADKVPGSVYDPFLIKRLGAKGYRQDVWAALDAYTKRATRKVHMDPALERIQEKLGSSLEYSNYDVSVFRFVQKYVDNINMRPTEKDTLLDNSMKQVVGYYFGQRPLTRLLKFFRQRTYVGMLGGNLKPALQNLSQVANTYAILGEKYTTIGYAKLLDPTAMKEAEEQGIFAKNFIEDRSINATMKLVQKVDNTLFVFFDAAEKINRGAAYHGAKAQYISKNVSIRDGVEVWKAGTSMEGAIQYAKKIVRKTQFNYDALDQPQLIASDIAKTFFQFGSYPLKQSEFLIELAKDKNYLGLVRYALAGTAFIYTIGQAFGMEPKDLIPGFRFGVPPSMKFPAEVTKAVLDSPDKYGKDRDLKKKLKDIGNSTLGLIPGGIQAKKTIQGYEAMKQGQSETSNGNKQFDVGGTPLKDAQALAFGKYANKQAKDYFDGVKTPEEKLIAEKADEKKKAKDLIKEKVQPIYDQAQELKAQGKVAEANALVANFTEEEKTVYKGIKQAEQADHTRRLRDLLSINSPEAVTYLRSLSKDEQQRIGTTILTDEERKQYAELKSQVQ